MNFCPQCGAKVENPDSKFCAVCGESFPQTTSEESPVPGTFSQKSVQPPQAGSTPAPSVVSGTGTGGIAGSFSSPFVTDAIAASPPKAEPLFSPVFAEEAASSGSSLLEEAPPPLVQKMPEAPAFSMPNFSASAQKPLASPLSGSLLQPSSAAIEDAPASAERPPLPEIPPSSALLGGTLAANTAPSPLAQDLFSAPPLAAQNLFEDAQPLADAVGQAPVSDFFADVPPEMAPEITQPPPADTGLFADAQPFAEAAPFAAPFSAPSASSKALFSQEEPAAAPKKSHTPGPVQPPVLRQEIPKPAASAPQVYPSAAAPATPANQDFFAAPAQDASPSTTAQRMPAAAPASLLAESASAAPHTPAPKKRRTVPPPPPSSRPQRETGRMVRNLLIGILVGLVLLFGAILGFLYWQNRPSETIDLFTAALAQRDYAALADTKNVSIVNVTNSNSEGWIALCDAFQDETTRNALSKELSRVSADPAKSNFAYPSIRLVGTPYFLFIKSYRVHVTGVDVLVPGAAEGIRLRLGAGDEFNDPSGVLDPEGMLYSGIMPGQYSATVTLPDGNSQNYSLSAFALSAPNAVEGEQTGGETGGEAAPTFGNLTIQNCVADDAQIFLNGQETPAKPTDGVVQLEQVELGTTISIKAVVNGATQEASVVFNDPASTTLAFGEYTETEAPPSAGGEITAEQAGATLTTFYQSYLDSINAQSLSGIKNSTQANTQNLEARISSPANKANTYTFVSAVIDPASLTTKDENGTMVAQFTATCSFSYVEKENPGEAQTGGNKQSVRLVLQDGQWLVDSFTNA